MADSAICDQIYVALENGPVEVASHGAFRHAAGIHGSSKAVKRALGSLIKRGVVRRHRPMPQGCTDMERPIVFELSYR